MNKLYIKIIIAVLLLGFLSFILSGCFDIGEHNEKSCIIELDNAEKVTATIMIYNGSLNIVGLNQHPLLNSQFNYNLTQLSPEISYFVQDSEGKLKIIQKNNQKGLFDSIESKWSLVFNKEVPLELDIAMGNGVSQLDFSDINLTDLKVAVGTGETSIDLTGDYQDSIHVYLIGGIGHTALKLPEDIGIRLFIDGMNHISCSGFNQIGKFYYNSAFDFSERKIFITIINWIGMIDIKLI